jgi:hypothetical protein
MFDHHFPKPPRKAGRLSQLNKRNRRVWATLPKSELLIAAWKDQDMRDSRGW